MSYADPMLMYTPFESTTSDTTNPSISCRYMIDYATIFFKTTKTHTNIKIELTYTYKPLS